MSPATNYDAGPSSGDILNFHFFPGLEDYRLGNYGYAATQMDYFIARPEYTAMNPRQSQFMSTALYVRGTIYLDHASGAGRISRAVSDLTEAIRWNPSNQPAYVALARARISLGQSNEAAETLRLLLARKPLASVAEEASRLLQSIAPRQ